jgi:aminopeptidase N
VIKELDFKKSTAELTYQLEHDQDVLGRIWSLNQLTAAWKLSTTSGADKDVIADELAKIVTADKFWGVRLEAATALADIPGKTVRSALLAATKDQRSRVRARAITSLAASKEPQLASVYQEFLRDPSYVVIRAASLALGQTKGPTAFDSLVKLIDEPSWHNTIRVSALSGLTELGDKRALEVALNTLHPATIRRSALLRRNCSPSQAKVNHGPSHWHLRILRKE